MRKSYLKRHILLCALLLVSVIVSAQTGGIRGKVSDENNQPLPAASVSIVGTTLGSTTDANGDFNIFSLKPGTYTVKVYYVGYIPQTRTMTVANAVSTITFSLTPQNTNLNEVVVIGYGSQRKNDLTGSVVAVSSKDFNPGPVTSFDELITGRYRTAIFWITEDHENNLWLYTNYGLVKLNVQTQETNIYGKDKGVVGDNITFGYTLRNGEILAGDTSGYFAFYPDEVLHSTPAPAIVINSFYLAEAPVLPAPGGVLSKPVNSTSKISLNHNQTNFSFSFTNIDFTSEEDSKQTFYMLENYDHKWRMQSQNEAASYYNVPPGNYIFKVKSINSNGLVSQKQIVLTISQAWYKTLWAYIIFVVLLIAGIWAFIYYRSLRLLKENRILEERVNARTEEVLQQKEEIETQRDGLEKTLVELKSTQRQLIQSEKMASLGELTAGIAHEIQNPLNFINNFSEVSRELIAELKEDIDKGDTVEVKVIASDLEQNLEKINHHGKRADAIVKGMLEHSRKSSGHKELTDINALGEEYLRLAYHGMRVKDKTFGATIAKDFDKKAGKVNIIAQDVGRVLLNLFNNAFYAVTEKANTAGTGYQPTVTIATKRHDGKVIITVSDNGNGIPKNITEKIFQPFFTTKPSGQGTGLGLSLSYDIIKAHEGEITVETMEGEGTKFIISLPA